MKAETHRAWRLHALNDLRLDRVETPVSAATGIIVRVEAATVLSFIEKVIDDSLGYALPPMPFVPGTNGFGMVEAVGEAVVDLRPGDRVFVSPHFIADERGGDPAQILIGHTAMGGHPSVLDGSRRLQNVWRDGVFAEKAHLPAASATRLPALSDLTADSIACLAKLIVPYGGLRRGRVEPGHVVIVNGATGYYGSAAVMVALAMGASRVIAAGRDSGRLAALAEALGPRVAPAILSGDSDADLATLRKAADGGADVALDLLGQATSTATTLAALRALRRGGRLVLMGSARAPLEITVGDMLANDWEVIGNFMYAKEAPAQLLRLITSGLLDLSPIAVARFPLADLREGIAAATKMRGLDLTILEPWR